MRKQNGFTLIEVLISLSLFSIISIGILSYYSFNITNCHYQIEILTDQQNIRYALNYIENTIRRCNQKKIIYHADRKTLELEDDIGKTVWIDLSGNNPHNKNILIYYYKDKGQLRSNTNGEHNVLVDCIKEITVKELIKEKLIEIEVFSDNINSSVKGCFKIKDW